MPGTLNVPGDMPRNDWQLPPWNRWSFQHVGNFLNTVDVPAGETLELRQEIRSLDKLTLDLPHLGECSLSSWLDESYTDGILIWHDGRVIIEEYFNGMSAGSLHLSQSVAKSFTAAIAGIFEGRGLLDTQAYITEYLPELASTAYRSARVQHVLDMASGVAFDETYTNDRSDVALMDRASGWKVYLDNETGPNSIWEQILSLKTQECNHGSRWLYRSVETDVLAFCLERISGKRLNELVSQELWLPMGAESTGTFTVDSSGYCLASGGFNPSLRDYARFGLLYAHGGRNLNGEQVVPSRWVDMTRHGNHEHFAKTGSPGLPDGAYKNQFWIHDQATRNIMCVGIHGQLIYIAPDDDFMVVKLSTWPPATDPVLKVDTLAAIRGIKEYLAA